MAKMRPLDTATLDAAAKAWAGHFLQNTVYSNVDKTRPVAGRDWVMNCFYDATFMDEHEYLKQRFRAFLGQEPLAEFDKLAKERFTPRDPALFEQLLADKLAILPDGTPIKGKVGTTQIGQRIIGLKHIEVESRDSIRRRRRLRLGKEHRETTLKVVPNKVPIYAGEAEAKGFRNLAAMLADEAGALNTNISAEIAILGLDALLDGLDEGTGAAVLCGYTGAQPADPDAAATGTKLFTCVCTDPAFAGASDQANGTVRASASSISDDTSADATGTVGYVRCHATNDGATPLDDHIDGEAGTSGADWNFNTTSIVSGATVSVTSWTVTLDQGSTAT